MKPLFSGIGIVLLSCLIACTPTDNKPPAAIPHDTTATSNAPNSPAATDSTIQSDEATGKPTLGDWLYRGGGNEPGWYIVLNTSEKNLVAAELVLDYGERKLKTQLMAVGTNDKEAQNRTYKGEATDEKGKSSPITLQITAGECIDDAEIKHQNQAILQVGEQTYKGCGDFGKK